MLWMGGVLLRFGQRSVNELCYREVCRRETRKLDDKFFLRPLNQRFCYNISRQGHICDPSPSTGGSNWAEIPSLPHWAIRLNKRRAEREREREGGRERERERWREITHLVMRSTRQRHPVLPPSAHSSVTRKRESQSSTGSSWNTWPERCSNWCGSSWRHTWRRLQRDASSLFVGYHDDRFEYRKKCAQMRHAFCYCCSRLWINWTWRVQLLWIIRFVAVV